MDGGEVTLAEVPRDRQGTIGDDVQAVFDPALLDKALVVLEVPAIST
jgi:hypothetical protein